MTIKNQYKLNVDIKHKYSGVIPSFTKGDANEVLITVLDNGDCLSIDSVDQCVVTCKNKFGSSIHKDCKIINLIGHKAILIEVDRLNIPVGSTNLLITLSEGNYRVTLPEIKVFMKDDIEARVNEATDNVNMELVNNKELNILIDGVKVAKLDLNLENYIQESKQYHLNVINEEMKKHQEKHNKLMENLQYTMDYWEKYYDDKLNEINVDAATGQVEIIGDLTESNILSEDTINNELTDDTSVSDFIDKIFEEARQIIDKRLNEIDDQNKYHINITVNESNASASKFATEIMNKLEEYKGSLS